MNFFALTNTGGWQSSWGVLLMWAVIFGAGYFFLMRPQQKKKKKEEELRRNVEIGDNIITIGGIVGRVVGVKEDDTLVIETGTDRAKIRVKRWAVGTVEKADQTAE